MKIVFFLFSLIFTLSVKADIPASVVDALNQADIPLDSVSIYVQPVDSTVPTISHNANKSMNPASVMKLVTTYVGLEALTPAYRWKTELYRDGEVKNGVLEGDLIIKGYGDPSFKAQEFWHLLMSLQQAGIQSINGDLVIDKTYFAKQEGERRAFDDEIWRAYNAEPSAFLVNGRNTSFKFSVQNGTVSVNQELELPQIKIINQMSLRSEDCGSWRNYFTYIIQSGLDSQIITFNGTYSPECEARYLELSLFDDELYAFYTFQKLWQELGGQFGGKLQVKALPLSAVKILEQQSEPLGNVIRDINKWSNNLMARQLLLTLAAEKQPLPATEIKGAYVVNQEFKKMGLNFDELVIENGSGLSRMERISAEHLGLMLLNAYHSPVMPEFISSMPILGLDGTVEKRLNGEEVKGRAHLKTGSIDAVSAIAGYILDHKNKRSVIVMLVNHTKSAMSKEAQDILINWLNNE
jgi:D-alanyl-D-alanine carboxypeptidase/D-alanyl-D-alanine-endopeptidase (penicillin-binding protein 4)